MKTKIILPISVSCAVLVAFGSAAGRPQPHPKPNLKVTFKQTPSNSGKHKHDVKLHHEEEVGSETNLVIQWQGKDPFSIILPKPDVNWLDWETNIGIPNSSPGLFNLNTAVVLDSDGGCVEVHIRKHPTDNVHYQIAIGEHQALASKQRVFAAPYNYYDMMDATLDWTDISTRDKAK